MAVSLPDIDYSYGSNLTPEVYIHEINYEGAYGQRARRGPQSQRQVWRLNWKGITEAEAETLRAFFEGLGDVDTITWTPKGQTGAKLFVSRGYQHVETNYDQWEAQVTLRQVFDNE